MTQSRNYWIVASSIHYESVQRAVVHDIGLPMRGRVSLFTCLTVLCIQLLNWHEPLDGKVASLRKHEGLSVQWEIYV